MSDSTARDRISMLYRHDLLRQFVLHAPAAVAMFDTQMRYLLVSRRWQTDYHLDDTKILGRSHYEVFPDVPQRWKDIHQRCLAGAIETCAEDQFDRADGSVEYIRWECRPWHTRAGQIGGLLMFTEVITQHVLQRKALSEKQATLQSFFDSSAFMMGVVKLADDGDVRFASANPATARFFGFTPEAFQGITLRQLAVPEERVAVWRSYYLRCLDGPVTLECPIVTPAGETRWVLMTLAQIATPEGGERLFAYTAHDITARRQAEDALRAAKEAAEAATQAKSEFLANMSHEIRTPMTAITGFADLLVTPGLSEAERLNAIATIRRNGDHLLNVINDILDLSKIEAGRLCLETVSAGPVQIINDVMATMRQRASAKGLPLHLRLPGMLPRTIPTDPMRLRQILVNLVGNAVKFTDRGYVALTVSMDPEAPEEAPRIRFQIADTGVGITPEVQRRLFAPFAQADASTTRKFGGTGLGLAISRRLADMLGGEITLQSTPGKGSTFTLTLPAGAHARDEMQQPVLEVAVDAVPTSATALAAVSARVLLVEDGPDNQALLQFHLTRAGASVTLADNGQTGCEKALQAWREATPFDLILMDMQMPVMDGYTATATLRNAGYTLPIIALTAHAMAGDRNKCLAAGCDDYATKPIDPPALLALLARYAPAGGGGPVPRAAEVHPAPGAGSETAQAAAPAPLTSTLLAEAPHMARLVERFVSRLPDRMTALQQALAAHDAGTLAGLAHQLKGAATGYGFPQITAAAAKLEMLARAESELAELQHAVGEITALCSATTS